MALKDAAGNYLPSEWPPILPVEVWKALISERQRARAGMVFNASGTRKYLLSGLLRCGNIRKDGSVCNRSLAGCVIRPNSGRPRAVYRCPGIAMGGCGGIQRDGAKLASAIQR